MRVPVGKIHGFWWDMNVDRHVDTSVNAIIRESQPANTVIVVKLEFDHSPETLNAPDSGMSGDLMER